MKIEPKILSKAAQLYNLSISDLRLLGGMEGMALEFRQGERDYVLKITPRDKGDSNQVRQIEEKSEFVNYLAENEVRVAQPIPSPSGNWVEVLETDEKIYLVSAATKAAGKHIEIYYSSQTSPAFFQAWGRVTGQMHALAKKYPYWQKNPDDAGSTSTISDWKGEHAFFQGWCQHDGIRQKWIELSEKIEILPQTREGFGLIHNDLHPWNFLVDTRGQITVIDFDVCAYHFFIKDIAIALFFANWNGRPPKGQAKDDYLTGFFRSFMTGYSLENDLEGFWFTQLPLFLRHHQILLHTVFSDEWKKPNPWQANTLQKWENQILKDIPVVSIQF
jgi:Ser/Thr protein kinase RdoA (MazF antagonist)